MDVTLCVDESHGPLLLSRRVQTLFNYAEYAQAPPCGIRQVARLVSDWAAQNKLCAKRGTRIILFKTIHWMIRVWCAFYLQRQLYKLPGTLYGCAAYVFHFIATFGFSQRAILFNGDMPFIIDRGSMFPGELVVITDGWRNHCVAKYRADCSVHGWLRQEAHSACRQAIGMGENPGGFWNKLSSRWDTFDAVDIPVLTGHVTSTSSSAHQPYEIWMCMVHVTQYAIVNS